MQRLTTFKRFMVDKEMRLSHLEYLTELNDHGFDELPRQYYRRIRETEIMVYTVEKGTPDGIVFNIFKRINTGGLVLEPQEIRHALYRGLGTELVKELARSDEFLAVTEKSVSPLRMLDCEYVTRFIAFTELDFEKDYRGNIDNFLIAALKRINHYEDAELNRIRRNFKRVMECSRIIFGKYAFRKITEESISPGVNAEVEINRALNISELRYEFTEGKSKTNLYKCVNVGFGITYVLPVIISIVSAKPGDIIILENPEAHIHPSGQSRLGELIAKAGAGGIQLIVETHSDHMINGIRLAVKKNQIESQQVNIAFFYKDDRDQYQHKYVSPKVLPDGRLDVLRGEAAFAASFSNSGYAVDKK